MFPRYGFAFLLGALLTMQSPQAPTLTEDEVRLITRPYTPPEQRTFRVRTNLVLVPVVVRDSRGKPIAGLKQSDFQVFDNGKQQPISAFSEERSSRAALSTPKGAAPARPEGKAASAPAVPQDPRFLALFFDDLNSRLEDIVAARSAAEKYIREALEPRDLVGIFTSSATVTLDFTHDTRAMIDSLEKIRTQFRISDEGPAACPPINPWQANLIINMNDREALELAIAEGQTMGCLPQEIGKGLQTSKEVLSGMAKNRAEAILSSAEIYSVDTLARLGDVVRYLGAKPGERTLLLISSGFFTRSPQAGTGQDRLMDQALRLSIVINSLDAKGLAAEAPQARTAFTMARDNQGQPAGLMMRNDLMVYSETLRSQYREAMSDPMAVLADGTGGRFFHNSNDLARGIREVATVPEVSYLLGFSPAAVRPDGKLHRLKVKLATPRGEIMQARSSYFAPMPAELARQMVLARFDSEVQGTSVLTGFVARVTTEPGKTESGEPALKLAVFFDVRGLYFQKRRDRSVSRLRCVFALFDSQGKYLVGREADVILALKEESLNRLSLTGLYQHLTLEAPAGAYRLRAVLQEQSQGQMATLNQSVAIP